MHARMRSDRRAILQACLYSRRRGVQAGGHCTLLVAAQARVATPLVQAAYGMITGMRAGPLAYRLAALAGGSLRVPKGTSDSKLQNRTVALSVGYRRCSVDSAEQPVHLVSREMGTYCYRCSG